MTTKTVAIITARKGSKRLPKKNIRPLLGKTLISYSIDEAIKSKYIDKIVVSTDDETIMSLVENSDEYNKKLLLVKRKKELSGDKVPTLPVLDDALKAVSKDYNTVILLQPTSPLRTVQHIDNCLKIFQEENCTSLVTVKEIDPFDVFTPNGAIFISTRNLIQKQHKLKDENVRLVVMPDEESIDIDTELDFIIAENILRWKNENRQT